MPHPANREGGRSDDRALTRARRVLQDIPFGSPILLRGINSDNNVNLSAYQSSPDEEIIAARSRGHRYGQLQPQTLFLESFLLSSTDDDQVTGDFLLMTPMKSEMLFKLSRKRLRLSSSNADLSDDSYTSSLSPSGETYESLETHCVKRQRTTDPPRPIASTHGSTDSSQLLVGLQAYTTTQLAKVIDKLVQTNPQLETEVRDALTTPDLGEYEQRLSFLRRAVYRAFPSVRWESTRDAFCYRRVKGHLEVFKSTCFEQLKRLGYSENWEAVLRYIIMSWTYVNQLPSWDDPSHNKIKAHCFAGLASHCMRALKLGSWSTHELATTRQRLLNCQRLNSQITPCIGYIDKLLLDSTR